MDRIDLFIGMYTLDRLCKCSGCEALYGMIYVAVPFIVCPWLVKLVSPT
jgi:hypothetical protein